MFLTFFRAPFGLFYHAAWFTQPHHKIGFETFLDTLISMEDVWIVTSWQAIQYLRGLPEKTDPLKFEPFQCQREVSRGPHRVLTPTSIEERRILRLMLVEVGSLS